RAVKVDSDVNIVPRRLAQLGEPLGGIVHLAGRLQVTRRPPLGWAGLEGGEAGPLQFFDPLGRMSMCIDTHPVPCWAAEQFINWHTERLPFDVPKRHVDATERTRENRATAVEG